MGNLQPLVQSTVLLTIYKPFLKPNIDHGDVFTIKHLTRLSKISLLDITIQ